jgi:hypothetical protein
MMKISLIGKELTMFAMTVLGATFSFIWFMLIVVAWIFLALLPASIARSKGHSFWGWFFVSLFFWWITLFITLFMSDRNTPSSAPVV